MEKRQEKGKAKHLKLIVQIIFFFGLTVLAFYYILKDNPKKTFAILSGARALPLTLGFFIVLVTILLDSLSLTILTKLYYPRYPFHQGLLNTMSAGMVGVYVRSAAPLLQAVTFQRQNVKNSEAASILTMNFLLYQLSLCLYSFVIILTGYPIMKNVPLAILWDMKLLYLVLIGMGVQLLFLLGAVLLAYCRPLHRLFLNSGINLMGKLHLLRNPEQTRKRLTIQFATYRIEMKRMKENRLPVLEVLGLNFLRLFLLGMLPFLVFISLIPSLSSNADFFAQSVVGTGFVNVLSSFLTVGAPEVTFQDTFSFFLSGVSAISNPETTASAANILWRLLTFYLVFLIGIVTSLLYHGSPKKNALLLSTRKIYDLELSEIKGADEETLSYLNEIHQRGGKYRQPLLSREEIEDSFASLKEEIEEKEDEAPNEEIDEILLREKSNLARVAEEYQKMVSATPSKEEIERETQKDNKFFAEKRKKKREKKLAKIVKQKERKAKKERKREETSPSEEVEEK